MSCCWRLLDHSDVMHCLNVNRMVLYSMSIERSIPSWDFFIERHSVISRRNGHIPMGDERMMDALRIGEAAKKEDMKSNMILEMSSTIQSCALPLRIYYRVEQNHLKRKTQEVRVDRSECIECWFLFFGRNKNIFILIDLLFVYSAYGRHQSSCRFWPGPIDRTNFTSYFI